MNGFLSPYCDVTWLPSREIPVFLGIAAVAGGPKKEKLIFESCIVPFELCVV